MTSRFLLWVIIWSPSETNHREMSRFQGKDGSKLGGEAHTEASLRRSGILSVRPHCGE